MVTLTEEQLKILIEQTFDEFVSSQLEDFLGSTYSSTTGKVEFIEELTKKILMLQTE